MFNSQSLTCAAIRKHLAQFNIFVELGTALEALEQDDESVTVQLKKGETTESAKFKYVFGVDGGRGKPRHAGMTGTLLFILSLSGISKV